MIKPSVEKRLQQLEHQLQEAQVELARSDELSQNQRIQLGKTLSEITPVVEQYQSYQKLAEELEQLAHLKDDEDMKDLVLLEMQSLETQLETIEQQLLKSLLPKDEDDEKNVYLEIRAGTGGEEASLFVGDLFSMYQRYCDKQKWQVEVLNTSASDLGGFREVVCLVKGRGVYARLKFESGAHRVQRVPQTETQGRVHTSACTVAILPQIDQTQSVEFDTKDLRVDTFRASGAGGQHVNKTDSAIRITHLPTGIAVECQQSRSQHQNRALALQMLSAKLLRQAQESEQKQTAQKRKELVGSGDRSERIRTYNFPQSRITDHRINLTLYNLNEFLQGDLDGVIDGLIQEATSQALLELGQD